MSIFVTKKAFVIMNSWSMGPRNLIIHHSCLKGFVYCTKTLYSNNKVGFNI